ncbi:hypothetical protein ACEPAI_6352 [Sanghuangporus weigelae]
MGDDNVLPDPSMKLLNACRDRRRLRNSVPSFSSFQLAYRLVKLFCIRCGLYAPHLRFLGDVHLEVMMRLVAERLPESFSAFELIKEFFRTYSSFDWASQTVSVTDSRMAYRRSAREPVVILSPQSPAINAAANPKARHWHRYGRAKRAHLLLFFIDYSSFVKVDVGYWGASCTSARALIGYMEPECFPQLQCNLFYAGLLSSRITAPTQRRKHEAADRCFGSIRRFNSKEHLVFDASTSFFAVAICTREDLLKHGNIEVDKPVWRDNGIDEALSTQEGPEAGMNPTSYWKEAEDNWDRQENFVKRSASKKQRKRANRNVSKVEDQGSVVKLRTSSDILQSSPLGSSSRSKQIEDENFITSHRNVHFRCKSTGELLWDRRTKLDRVFGSGVLTSER